MKITRRTDYAIHLLVDLAAHPDECLGLRALSESHGVTYAFARTVQRGLLRSGLVLATRGIYGGVRLAKPLNEITLLEVFEAAQNPLHIAFSSDDYAWSASYKKPYMTEKLWSAAENSMRGVLTGVTVQDLLSDSLSV